MISLFWNNASLLNFLDDFWVVQREIWTKLHIKPSQHMIEVDI